MSENRLTKLLGSDGIAVCDGAMGTMLYARGVFVNRSFEELNLSNPEMVRSVHREYLEAGADVLESNTFGANRFKLAPHGYEELVSQLNQQGALLAREEARAVQDRDVLVAGSMGPLGVRIEPWGAVSVDEARGAFREQAEGLLEGGVDLIVLETFYHLPELQQAVEAVREVSAEVPLVAQVTVTEEGSTPEGIEPTAFTRSIDAWDVDGIGVNCGVGPVATLEAIEDMRTVTDRPLSAMPNAGQPRNIHGRNIYLSSPEYVASYARRFIKAGVRVVGGCCGTVPEHVRAIKEAVIAVRPEARHRAAITTEELAEVAASPLPLAEKSTLGRRLAAGEFAVGVQILPPRGCNPESALAKARSLHEGGVDLLTIPEGKGGARMPPFATAQICQQEHGVEAVVEYACRDRSLLRMQSELLGAHALGIRDIVLSTGAPPTPGEPGRTGTLEVDSIGLTNVVRRLNQGLDIGGNSIGDSTGFLIGVHFDPFAVDLDFEVRRCEWKVDAGAEFALTPPILDVEAFKRFLGRIEHCRIPIIASVAPLAGYRTAERIRRRTGQTGVPEDVLERLRAAEPEGKEAEVGFSIVMQTVEALRSLVQGIQVITPEDDPAQKASLELVRGIRS